MTLYDRTSKKHTSNLFNDTTIDIPTKSNTILQHPNNNKTIDNVARRTNNSRFTTRNIYTRIVLINISFIKQLAKKAF